MHRLAAIVMLLAAVWSSCPRIALTAAPLDHDVTIYGATPAGIATAIMLARGDRDLRILLVTRYQRVGGLITNGLTHPDFRTFEARTGLFREFNQRVEQHYSERFGAESPQVKDSLMGTHAGPEVNHTILRQMLDLPGITILTGHHLASAETLDNRVTSITLNNASETIDVHSDYFVDATYEGDLMAAAGVAFEVGREAQSRYGESLAPDVADAQVQGYNFRLTMTDVPANRAAVPKPADYDRADFADLLTLLEQGALPRIFGDPLGGLPGGIYKRQTPKLPNGKRDINDVSRSIVRLSLPNLNQAWPTGDAATRQKIFSEHLRHNVGMLYFLQNDPAVPDKFANESREWGLCRDELAYNNHLPEQLYVREARRMLGQYVFTQKDVERAPGTHHARAVFQADSIAMGDYGPNCHGTAHEGPQIGGQHTGEFYQRAAPYQIPYGTLLPKNVQNLAVPVACSSSHVGFCALRLEPIWMSLGQATGAAILIAQKEDAALHHVAPQEIRRLLHAAGAATIYTSDVPEESRDFRAVQWWGSLGGLVAIDRGLEDEPAEYGRRGSQVIGQYYAAFPEHAVDLHKPMDDDLRSEWTKLAAKQGIAGGELATARTRGEFIHAAWNQQQQPTRNPTRQF